MEKEYDKKSLEYWSKQNIIEEEEPKTTLIPRIRQLRKEGLSFKYIQKQIFLEFNKNLSIFSLQTYASITMDIEHDNKMMKKWVLEYQQPKESNDTSELDDLYDKARVQGYLFF